MGPTEPVTSQHGGPNMVAPPQWPSYDLIEQKDIYQKTWFVPTGLL